MKQIEVRQFWQSFTHRVEPGVYDVNDPAVAGVVAYLLDNGIAVRVGIHPDSPVSFEGLTQELGAQWVTSDGQSSAEPDTPEVSEAGNAPDEVPDTPRVRSRKQR